MVVVVVVDLVVVVEVDLVEVEATVRPPVALRPRVGTPGRLAPHAGQCDCADCRRERKYFKEREREPRPREPRPPPPQPGSAEYERKMRDQDTGDLNDWLPKQPVNPPAAADGCTHCAASTACIAAHACKCAQRLG